MTFRTTCRVSLACAFLLGTAACSASSAPAVASAGGLDGSVVVGGGDGGASQGSGDDASVTSPGSGGGPADGGGGVSPSDAAFDGPDLDLQASDFECILRWAKAGDFRITNKLVDPSASIAVANADGGTYPVGTIIQLIPNEAMVKRHVGFNPAGDDWEFFNLTTSASGTVINQRGGAEVTNAIGSCSACHQKAQSQYDFVCGTTHGCTPLPFTEAQIVSIQNGDPRCP